MAIKVSSHSTEVSSDWSNKEESNDPSENSCGYWQLQLDRDLVDTISAIYPEWFKHNMAEGGGSSQAQRESSPKAVIDTSPLHINQNKESLKVKLMLRRPLDQLVDQGIMPPHKTPAAYHGQRRQLERAKTGDMLKAKIQQRPSRQELERRHILESDPGHLDPSLVERQRMLKKAKLTDQLNDQLSHRPGPLELIRKNILHTEEPIEQAVKTGKIPYKATSEGQLKRPQHPSSYITPEDDSQSSAEGDLLSPATSDMLETAAKSAGIVVSLIPATEGTVVLSTAGPMLNKDNTDIMFADLCRSVTAPLLTRASASSPASLTSTTSTLSPLSSVASPVPTIVSQPGTPIPPPLPPIALTPRPSPSPAKSDVPGKDKNRKKSKSKSIPKARTIKFHEYKGPPSAQKNSSSNSNSGESSYDLLLQQQTLLLQFQLQLQHKYPQIILPAAQETQSEANNNSSMNNPQPSPAPSTSSESSVANKASGRLEDMKVSDLKAELKRRNLPVSGSKPQLIERLKLFSSNQIDGSSQASFAESVHSNSSIDHMQNSPIYQDIDSPEDVNKNDSEPMDIGNPLSPTPQVIMKQEPLSPPKLNEQPQQRYSNDIVKEQQKKIEELQRELTLSQLKLQAATRSETKAQVLALQKHLQAKQQQQATLQIQQLQALQARQSQMNEEQQRLQQQQHVAFQNQKNLANGLVLNSVDAAMVLNQLIHGKVKFGGNNHQRTNSLPNFFNTVVSPVIPTSEPKPEVIEIKPPPVYEEVATTRKNSVKSQIVDDVLEILIKNGELPPSAAQDPVTPNSGETKIEPIYPNHVAENNNHEDSFDLNPNDLIDSLENLDGMDLSQFAMELGPHNPDNNNMCIENDAVPMDTDEWLESLLPSEDKHSIIDGCNSQHMSIQEPDLNGYDPLLALSHDPFDPFNLDEFRNTSDLTAALSWDKIDYAA
ncbi:myocardin-related transcription factor B isoform X4 [Coccinella septempunctata]|uniref:myocardin-related transcription factor B isoform X4 n=1 Tax=Coccinella septempunctata TaxID=41139 RepID=UPI001D095DD0|nr:myocardin-related transcription factor B isoform X4 [Coccinella septempunctata]